MTTGYLFNVSKRSIAPPIEFLTTSHALPAIATVLIAPTIDLNVLDILEPLPLTACDDAIV